MSTIAKDNPYPLDKSGVAIVTHITEDTTANEIVLMNMSCYSRNEDLPEPDVSRIVRYSFSNLMPMQHLGEIYQDVVKSFEKLHKEEIVSLVLHGIPGVSLYDFVPTNVEVGGSVQWEPNDIKELLRAIRKACGVTMILH